MTTAAAETAAHDAERARDAATRAERAADQSDGRLRDADRWIRWGIALVLGAVLSQVLLTLTLFDRLAAIQAQNVSLEEAMEERFTAVEEAMEERFTAVEGGITALQTAVEELAANNQPRQQPR